MSKSTVDETEISNVEVGQQAKVKVDALGDKEIVAVVTQKNTARGFQVRHAGRTLESRERSGSQGVLKSTVELRDMPG